MNKSIRCALAFVESWIICVSVHAAETAKPYAGNWALTIPGGGAGWLGVEQKDGNLKASILWGSGSVVPVDRAKVDGDTLRIERDHKIQRRDATGKVIRTDEYTETIVAKVSGAKIQGTKNQNG